MIMINHHFPDSRPRPQKCEEAPFFCFGQSPRRRYRDDDTIVWIEKNAIVSAILQDLFYLSTACSHYKRSRSVVDKKIETRAVQSVTQVLY